MEQVIKINMKTLEERFGNWWSIVKNEVDKPYFKKLANHISKRRKETEVYPTSENVFKAFQLTNPDDVKVIWLGLDPYNNFSAWTNAPVADGLCFSTNSEDRTPPSLSKIHQAIEEDCYDGLNLDLNNNLEYLAEQGVLLLNSYLTVEKFNSLSHQNLGWEEFNVSILNQLFNDNLPRYVITFGSAAKKLLEECVLHSNIEVINLEHPAYACRQGRKLEHKNTFSKANEFIQKHYGVNSRIKW